MKTLLSIAVSAFLLVIGFQNCAKVDFQAALQQDSNSPTAIAANTATIRSLQPALAVRAVGCLQCHANISSNLVTDFGYGDNFYFGRNLGGSPFNSGTPYTDYAQNFKTITMSPDKQIVVPRAALPSDVAAASNTTSLADYLKQQLAGAADARTKTVSVNEVKNVVIAAPTEADLENAFQLGAARSMFIKSLATELDGLSDRVSFFENSGTLVCDGDLVVRGPLYLKNLSIQTVKGCRIYVIGSVFETGAITFVGKTDLSNLQITATRSINLGLGKTTNADGTFCQPNSKVGQGGYGDNTVVNRYTQMWTVPGQNVRGTETPQEFGQRVVDDLHTIESAIGSPIKDAECSGGRDVAFERVLLNAPVVMSRYWGDVRGTIIAEFALMSLNNFKFEFDPVFENVDVLPKLSETQFLQYTK